MPKRGFALSLYVPKRYLILKILKLSIIRTLSVVQLEKTCRDHQVQLQFRSLNMFFGFKDRQIVEYPKLEGVVESSSSYFRLEGGFRVPKHVISSLVCLMIKKSGEAVGE